MGDIRVLIVDDFGEWRRTLCRILTRDQKFKVIAEASNGLDAVSCAEKLQPELVLLDIGLPQLNGIEAARRITKVSPDSKIIFVTENASIEVREEALRAGGREYVLKSNTENELLRAVNAITCNEQV